MFENTEVLHCYDVKNISNRYFCGFFPSEKSDSFVVPVLSEEDGKLCTKPINFNLDKALYKYTEIYCYTERHIKSGERRNVKIAHNYYVFPTSMPHTPDFIKFNIAIHSSDSEYSSVTTNEVSALIPKFKYDKLPLISKFFLNSRL